jgi:hypothetical protein
MHAVAGEPDSCAAEEACTARRRWRKCAAARSASAHGRSVCSARGQGQIVGSLLLADEAGGTPSTWWTSALLLDAAHALVVIAPDEGGALLVSPDP